jgi:hypothetical protein
MDGGQGEEERRAREEVDETEEEGEVGQAGDPERPWQRYPFPDPGERQAPKQETAEDPDRGGEEGEGEDVTAVEYRAGEEVGGHAGERGTGGRGMQPRCLRKRVPPPTYHDIW